MQDLKVTSWQLFGHDRLYVNLPDGTAIGWADLASGTITVLHPRYRDAVTDALARQVPDIPALGEVAPPGPPVPPPVPRIPPLRRLRKRGAGEGPGAGPADGPSVPLAQPATSRVPQPRPPTAPETGPARVRAPGTLPASASASASPSAPPTAPAPAPRQGDRVPASGPVAEPRQDRASAPGPVAPGPVAEPRQDRASASGSAPGLRPHGAPATASVPPPGRSPRPELPALTPADDLAARRPGAALREQLDGSGPTALVRAATGALRRHKDADPRRTALAGERRSGAELKRLTRHGWRVLHSVPLPDGSELGHLLIGPGGVFAVHTEHHPQASVRVGEDTLQIDDGIPRPHALADHPGTATAQAVLEAHCTFPVPVHTVLVFVGVAALDVVAAPAGVRVHRDRQVSALAPLTGVLTPTQVEKVYDVARHREAWLGE
ncbi:NERD domain-containing protein [Streptomyces sp. B1I3]|uniref:NERD domain-containing protein n=1 Tax=Streptomyces sp. B1I3 TaxID=3042264 RepID=UPI00278AF62E|nr:NERD domain-containing protein [Streptomyces sp. B1I3]MDQ0793992.1 hypothetical protein [Streptomyces sp. B1I3]